MDNSCQVIWEDYNKEITINNRRSRLKSCHVKIIIVVK